MSNDELRVKVAELMGWTKHKLDYAHVGGGAVFETFWLRPGVDILTLSAEDICWREGASLPDYPNDLNACAQLRASLTEEERERYTFALYSLTQSHSHNSSWNIDWSAIDATAEQHCIAYLKTKQAI